MLKLNISGNVSSVFIYVNQNEIKPKYGRNGLTCNCELVSGINRIHLIKKAELADKGWWKIVFSDWLSALAGVLGSNLKDIDSYTNCFELSFDINAMENEDLTVCVKLTSRGFVLEKDARMCTNIRRQRSTDSTAIRRSKRLYLTPFYLLCALIAGFFVCLIVFLLLCRQVLSALMVTAILVMLVWLYKNSDIAKR